MNITIFGLGYVGTVTAACLARHGHRVVGVDRLAEKVDRLNAGQTPIVEPGVAELLAAHPLTATLSAGEALQNAELSIISVGTPPLPTGEPNLEFVEKVCREIGSALRGRATTHVVVLRSTCPPGTLARCRAWLDEASGGAPVALAFNPEFLREGTAVRDFQEPPMTVIGTHDDEAEAALRALYAPVSAPVIVTEPQVAEMVKYVSNAWHATKISFANEVGRIAQGLGVSGHAVMDLVTTDTKLNCSKAYMRPGFAYGGSCLPKDLNGLLAQARRCLAATPLLEAVGQSNTAQIDAAVARVLAEVSGQPGRSVAVMGLAFKPGTDDLRESAAVTLVKRLLGEGCDVRIFDEQVHTARLLGTNLAFIRDRLPHFEALLQPTADQACDGVDVVVQTYSCAALESKRIALLDDRPGLPWIDLTRALSEPHVTSDVPQRVGH